MKICFASVYIQMIYIYIYISKLTPGHWIHLGAHPWTLDLAKHYGCVGLGRRQPLARPPLRGAEQLLQRQALLHRQLRQALGERASDAQGTRPGAGDAQGTPAEMNSVDPWGFSVPTNFKTRDPRGFIEHLGKNSSLLTLQKASPPNHTAFGPHSSLLLP